MCWLILVQCSAFVSKCHKIIIYTTELTMMEPGAGVAQWQSESSQRQKLSSVYVRLLNRRQGGRRDDCAEEADLPASWSDVRARPTSLVPPPVPRGDMYLPTMPLPASQCPYPPASVRTWSHPARTIRTRPGEAGIDQSEHYHLLTYHILQTPRSVPPPSCHWSLTQPQDHLVLLPTHQGVWVIIQILGKLWIVFTMKNSFQFLLPVTTIHSINIYLFSTYSALERTIVERTWEDERSTQPQYRRMESHMPRVRLKKIEILQDN